MGRPNRAAARGQSGKENLLNPQPIQPQAGSHHIHDRIDRPHLVELHLFWRNPMHRPFRLGQLPKDRSTPLHHPIG
jgi:hypothetical protein